jgi:hypothetical protein
MAINSSNSHAERLSTADFENPHLKLGNRMVTCNERSLGTTEDSRSRSATATAEWQQTANTNDKQAGEFH